MTPDFEAVLKLHMGLDAASIGSASVDRAVQRRRAICGLSDDAAYFDLLISSSDEIQELIETVAVPETWFFRDPEAFAALVEIVRDQWLPNNARGVFRVASLPCSTGEEPFSIAMALIEAGVPRERFAVDAIDISRRSLVVAEKGIYGRNSFRGRGKDYRDPFFEPTQGGWKISDEVKAQVCFRTGNILASEMGRGESAYDAVFCRNLLIYFDLETQIRALASIKRILKREGWFFAGPSETSVAVSQGFASARIPLAFAFRPKEILPTAAPAPVMPEMKRTFVSPRKPRLVTRRPVVRAAQSTRPAKVVPVSPPTRETSAEISHAAQLADSGALAKAASICERVLRKESSQVQAYYVLALVRDAAGMQTEAATLYRKVLFLDPKHREAMTQLAVLLGAQGRAAEAKILSDRARRLEPIEGGLV